MTTLTCRSCGADLTDEWRELRMHLPDHAVAGLLPGAPAALPEQPPPVHHHDGGPHEYILHGARKGGRITAALRGECGFLLAQRLDDQLLVIEYRDGVAMTEAVMVDFEAMLRYRHPES
jgi:hypothetical protein